MPPPEVVVSGGGSVTGAAGVSVSLMISFSNWPSVSACNCAGEPVYTLPAESPQKMVPSALLPHTMLSQLLTLSGLLGSLASQSLPQTMLSSQVSGLFGSQLLAQ